MDLSLSCRPMGTALRAASTRPQHLQSMVRPLSRRSGCVPAWPYPPLRSPEVYRILDTAAPLRVPSGKKSIDRRQRFHIWGGLVARARLEIALLLLLSRGRRVINPPRLAKPPHKTQ